MHSTLIVARMAATSSNDVAQLFADFDATEMPHRMGTRRRQLFSYRGLDSTSMLPRGQRR
ncbi:TcmI family type II polyketide cyclase OS=Streptomyces rochei OX=1928 GN=G3I25_32290 PE=4 SV=1 [Streptomyces rochei]